MCFFSQVNAWNFKIWGFFLYLQHLIHPMHRLSPRIRYRSFTCNHSMCFIGIVSIHSLGMFDDIVYVSPFFSVHIVGLHLIKSSRSIWVYFMNELAQWMECVSWEFREFPFLNMLVSQICQRQKNICWWMKQMEVIRTWCAYI